MSFSSQDADMNEDKLGWSSLCSGQRQCWQLALNHSHYSGLKSSIYSEITSCIMQTFTDQVSRQDNEFGLVFQCQVMKTFRETGESPAPELALMTGWMSHVQHYTQHLFWENTSLCYIWLLCCMTGKIWIAYPGMWIFSVHIKQHNAIGGFIF